MKQNRKNKINLLAFFLFLFFFSFTFISGEEFGYNYLEAGENLDQKTYINYTEVNVNASDWWITAEGNLDNVVDILISWITPDDYDMTGYNLTASWFNGKFNWTSISNFLIFDGSSLDYNETALNESIDARTISKYYNATTIDTIEGTYDSGDIYSIQIPEDGDTYNVSEDVGANPLLININFTNISDFNMVVGRIYYEGGSGHEIQLEIYRVDTEVWENYEEYTDMTDYVNIHVPIFDGSKHIDATGNVSVRFDHFQNGLPNHEFSIDYLNLVDGWTTLTTADHDGLSGRDLITNHPQYLDTDATRNVTGNLTLEQNLFVDGNVTTINWFNGLFNWTTLTNWLSFDGAKLIFNETKLNETIDNRATGLGDNESWNESYADTKYGGGIGNASWNESYANTIYLMNNTFNVTYHSFITNVSTNYTEKTVTGYDSKWSSTFNSTYESYQTNVSLNYSELVFTTWDSRWYQVLWDAIFNSSFDDRISSLGDNASWNESYGNTLYLQNNTFNATYDSYSTNVSTNYTEKTVEGYDTKWSDTYNSTYDSYATNVSTNYTENTVTGYDTRWLDGNTSWNESYGNTLYLQNNTFNQTYHSYQTNISLNYSELTFDTWNAVWSATGGNASWNESYADTRYSVNNTYNATYDSYQTNVSLNYSELTFTTWDSRWLQNLWDATFNTSLTDFFNTLFGGKTTDDLPEGSSNFYENQSWNESYSNTIYLMNNTFNATYDSYSTNVSLNYSEEVFNTWDSRWLQNLWDATFNTSFDDRDSDTIFTPTNVAWINESNTFVPSQTFSNNITLEGVKFEVDSSNHRIYDNASCIIMQSGTTELRICE